MFAYVGCRTAAERNGQGRGIRVFHAKAVDDDIWTEVQAIDGLVNPSYLLLSQRGTELYVVHGDASEVSAYKVDAASGRLSFLCSRSTFGLNPVHLAIDPSGSHLIIANYKTGSIVSLPIRPDGSLGTASDMLYLPGEVGPHRSEQGSSHPHQCLLAPDGRLLVPDKGLDRIFSIAINPEDGRLSLPNSEPCKQRPGAGPRHAAFHPDGKVAYVVNELENSLASCSYEPMTGNLSPVHVVSAIPASFIGKCSAAGIAVDSSGRFLYVSLRGHDSIATFHIDQENSLPRLEGWTNCGGLGPRFIALSPCSEFLIVANELSGSIVRFGIDPSTGSLHQIGNLIETGSPTCVLLC